MTIEAGVLIDAHGEPIHWHVPADRTAASLPDSRILWDVIWTNRHNLSGFAHSHPGSGMPGPSFTDVSTFSAVELALGDRLNWWITSSDHLVLLRWAGPSEYTYRPFRMDREPAWVHELRERSLIYPSAPADQREERP